MTSAASGCILLLLGPVLLSAEAVDDAVLDLYRTPREGSLSYYWNLSESQRGTCFQWPEPAAGKNGVWTSVALPVVSSQTFYDGRTCGMCIEFLHTDVGRGPRYLGSKHGGPEEHQPPANERTRLFVNNACGDCEYENQMDVSLNSRKGLWQATWVAVDCEPDTTPVQFIFGRGSSEHFIGLQARNLPIPVKGIEYYHPINDKWYTMSQGFTGMFKFQATETGLGWPDELLKPPLRVRVTSLKGQALETNVSRIGEAFEVIDSDPPIFFEGITGDAPTGSCTAVEEASRTPCGPSDVASLSTTHHCAG
ncbi:unnamed protein product [Vitrella brassicaformis CCMP3155]|uniref:Expansin-like EG45 domain-containing protein n=1 Tax=Vitrella brassicaformis (strain CCMP3155) TaxID=1169540 RepID=A0A0G4E9I6_VITBC|nr:unnamed protein product [Vitrella brassicaformis CCMP3155]|eukprot:CEL91889.1 unnamed protein product [Vitrella brassicaformis CCMP3155]